jgi:hypothetical protein
MGFTVEFHDSELRDVRADGATLRVRFAAAAARKFGVRSVFLQRGVTPFGDASSCKKTDLTPNSCARFTPDLSC